MKFKRLISGVIVAAVCTPCVFNLVACGEKNSGKDTPVYYTVTFYCNTGLEEDSVQKQVEKGKIAADKVPDVMIKTGYTFDGWYRDEAFTQEFDIANTPITSDLSLYARWKQVCDRAWFLSKLGECAANAKKDGVVYQNASYKARIDGKPAEDYASEIVNDRISVGEYSVSIRIAAEKFENEVLNVNTVSSERYAVNGDGFSATIHYVNADNVRYVYSVYVNRYTDELITRGKIKLKSFSSVKIQELQIAKEDKSFYYIEWHGDNFVGTNHFHTNLRNIDYEKYMSAIKKVKYDNWEGF